MTKRNYYARPYIITFEHAQGIYEALRWILDDPVFRRTLTADKFHGISTLHDFLEEKVKFDLWRLQEEREHREELLRKEIAKNTREQQRELTAAEQNEWDEWEARQKKNEHESLVPLRFRKPLDDQSHSD